LDFNRSVPKGKERSSTTTRGHTGVMVPVFAYGPGAENFTGINENTSFYSKILNVLRLKE
jgi:alkaline phosphatase